MMMMMMMMMMTQNKKSAGREGRYLHSTQQTQGTNINSVSGIRTHNPTNHAAADQRHLCQYLFHYLWSI
jgi:hypothetical protein